MNRQVVTNVGDSPALVVKLLRYYARVIVVCLLLRKIVSAQNMLQELSVLVKEYGRVFKTNDLAEWQAVVQEIVQFIDVSVRYC
jgi:hypothetical protein